MNLTNLPKIKGNKKPRTKLGRGYGSGHGHTSGRGQKGQKARTGTAVPWYFEGGQLPLVKRLPHVGGFNNVNRVTYVILKTSKINALKLKEVNTETLLEAKIIKNKNQKVKVLFDKELDSAVSFKNVAFSKTAKETILKAKGKIN